MSDIIPFEKDAVKEYLDKCIKHWRIGKKITSDDEDKLVAACYVDAFQSVRISIFGELLKD